MIISINLYTRSEFIKRVIKSFNKIILSSHIITSILIIYVKILLEDKDLLFKS